MVGGREAPSTASARAGMLPRKQVRSITPLPACRRLFDKYSKRGLPANYAAALAMMPAGGRRV